MWKRCGWETTHTAPLMNTPRKGWVTLSIRVDIGKEKKKNTLCRDTPQIIIKGLCSIHLNNFSNKAKKRKKKTLHHTKPSISPFSPPCVALHGSDFTYLIRLIHSSSLSNIIDCIKSCWLNVSTSSIRAKITQSMIYGYSNVFHWLLVHDCNWFMMFA